MIKLNKQDEIATDRFLVYADKESYPLRKGITAISLIEMMKLIQ